MSDQRTSKTDLYRLADELAVAKIDAFACRLIGELEDAAFSRMHTEVGHALRAVKKAVNRARKEST